MKTYTFNTRDLNNGNNINTFLGKSLDTDYSKILDDIIADSVKQKNSYLFDTTPVFKTDSLLKNKPTTDFDKAIDFLSNYKKTKQTFILGKTYHLADGTPIIFYDDEIQIGFYIYKYTDFNAADFIGSLTPETKKIIIDIYTNADNLKININL